ncbi:MAG: hypothetical protein KDB07_09690, partial [Planctomycetes bacterium]|nr:hypothetical protein [Planctomycetota bacterium]
MYNVVSLLIAVMLSSLISQQVADGEVDVVLAESVLVGALFLVTAIAGGAYAMLASATQQDRNTIDLLWRQAETPSREARDALRLKIQNRLERFRRYIHFDVMAAFLAGVWLGDWQELATIHFGFSVELATFALLAPWLLMLLIAEVFIGMAQNQTFGTRKSPLRHGLVMVAFTALPLAPLLVLSLLFLAATWLWPNLDVYFQAYGFLGLALGLVLTPLLVGVMPLVLRLV